MYVKKQKQGGQNIGDEKCCNKKNENKKKKQKECKFTSKFQKSFVIALIILAIFSYKIRMYGNKCWGTRLVQFMLLFSSLLILLHLQHIIIIHHRHLMCVLLSLFFVHIQFDWNVFCFAIDADVLLILIIVALTLT